LSTFLSLSLSLSLSLFLCRLLCFSGGDLTDSRGGTCLVTSLVENAVTSRGMILVKDEQSHGYCEVVNICSPTLLNCSFSASEHSTRYRTYTRWLRMMKSIIMSYYTTTTTTTNNNNNNEHLWCAHCQHWKPTPRPTRRRGRGFKVAAFFEVDYLKSSKFYGIGEF